MFPGSLILKMLCEEDLVASIKDNIPNFSIHVSDLEAPIAQFLQSYYVRVLEEVGVDVDELQEQSVDSLYKLDFPDVYKFVLLFIMCLKIPT
jgi:hypothetical protein